MSVRQIKDGPQTGRWVVDYYPNGRKGKRETHRLPADVTTVSMAKRIEATLRKSSQTAPGEMPHERTIKALSMRYLSVKAKGSKSTYRDVRNTFQANVLPTIGHIDITVIGPQHFSFYKEVRGATGVSNRTINKEVSYIRGMCRWAAAEKIAKPLMFRTDRLPQPKRLPRVLSHDEAVAIVNAAENTLWRCFFALLYFLGLRLAEAGGLRWSDIDWTGRSLIIRQGKGDKCRLLPLEGELPGLLKALKDEKQPQRPDTYIFHNQTTRRPLYCYGTLARAVKLAGVMKKVTPHVLRHTFATELLRRSIGLSQVQALMGHSTIAITQIYTHLNVDDLRQGMANFTTLKKDRKHNTDKAQTPK